MLADPRLRRAVLAAAAAHAVLLAWLPSVLQPEGRGGVVRLPSMLVQLVTPAAPTALSESPRPALRETEAPPPAASIAPLPALAQPAAAAPVTQSQTPTQTQAAQMSSPAPAEPAPGAEFLPRSRLTVAPAPLSDIHVPIPDDVRGVVDLRVQVALFIDSTGAVQRVRLDTPNVPPRFAQAIHEQIGAARFKPGELDGRAVGAMIRMEFEFATGVPR